MKTLLIVVCLLWSVSASAQPIAGDRLVSAWDAHRSVAQTISNWTVVASLSLDTWASWQASDRKHAFVKQAQRDGAILLATELTKRIVHRQRPDASDRLSFWSGHTAFAASALGGKRLAITLPLTVETGYLRIAGGKHFVSDTVVGGLVGALAGRFLR